MGLHALETKWADIEIDDENDTDEAANKENYGFETAPDEFGIKNVIYYSKNARGQTIKTIKRVKEIIIPRRINKEVYERKNLPTFNLNSAAMQGTSIVSQEDILIDIPKHTASWNDQYDDYYFTGTDITAARMTRDLKQKFKSLKAELNDDVEPTPVESVSNKYVPPSRKDGDRRLMDQQKEESTIRVTNLSEDVKEKDLMDLFGSVGNIYRTYLAKDKETQSSRGFAFITYYNKKDALTAIAKFNRRGYDNLLLNVELAKSNQKEF